VHVPDSEILDAIVISLVRLMSRYGLSRSSPRLGFHRPPDPGEAERTSLGDLPRRGFNGLLADRFDDFFLINVSSW
jgi:hypothetical protein